MFIHWTSAKHCLISCILFCQRCICTLYVTQVAYRCLLEACLSLSHLERRLFFVDIKISSIELLDSVLLWLQTFIKCEFVCFTDSTQTRVSWRLRPVLESCKCYEKGFVNMSIVFRFCLISDCCIWLRKYYFSTGLCLQQCCVEHGTSCPCWQPLQFFRNHAHSRCTLYERTLSFFRYDSAIHNVGLIILLSTLLYRYDAY